jgi:dCMP deaminase
MSKDMFYLSLAGQYAKQFTGCTKVAVGSCIVKNGSIIAMGANRAIPNLCRSPRGCLRVELYGDNSKLHRNPEDCRAIHSEVDAIGNAAKSGVSTEGATIYVTRYPCEACARLIITAGIKKVVYGRNQSISKLTEQMFESAGVYCYNCGDYMEDDTVI